MSVFQSREWWGVRVSATEEFDEKHLWVENIDNSPTGSDKIIVGSFSGFLRIYQPERNPYSIEHLLYESDLGAPIMQIQGGQFKKTNEPCLCVLFFQKVCFYQFSSINDGGLQAKLLKDHKLERNAFNMCVGPFGGSKSDYVCIQSCDAMLMIYEPEQFQCMCQLSTEYFPLPGAFIYNSLIDAFVIQNSSYEVECYKYSNIVSTSQAQLKDPKRPQPDWTLNLGEQAQKIIDVKRSQTQCDMVIVTEQMLFVVSQTGTIRNQKKFDYPPATFIINNFVENKSFLEESNGDKYLSLFIVVGSFTHHLMVYKDFQLLWAAKTDHVCHGLQLGKFGGQKGLITVLNDQGWLQVIYLGTESPTVQNELQTSSKLNYQEMDQQYSKILDKISAKDGKQSKTQSQQQVNLNLNAQCQEVSLNSGYFEDSKLYFKENNKVFETKVRITISSNTDINNLNITIVSDLGTIAVPDKFQQESYREGGTPLTFTTSLYASSSFQPIERSIKILASFLTKAPGAKNAQTHCKHQILDLPFKMYCTLKPPTKQAEFKITLTVNKPIELFTLFSDLIELAKKLNPQVEESISNPNALTLLLCNTHEVTVLVSKNLDKWRIQSNNFESINFFMEEICVRIEKLNQSQFSFVDQIPLQDIFNQFDEHYNLRQSSMVFEQQLEHKAIEFRNIQKKLLSRFKEKNPASTTSLDLLLQTSFQSMIKLIESAQKCKEDLNQSTHKLQIVTKLLLNLIKLRFDIPQSFFVSLKNLFPTSQLEGQIGWQEVVYGNLNYFLRTMMKKDVKEQIQTPQYAQIEDTAKLKKIITILVDKISKGTLNI